jgi:hypothetical protein
LADKIDIPFYLMTFPFKKSKEKNEWASHVLQTKHANIDQVWQIYAYLEKLNLDTVVIRRAQFSHHRLVTIVAILQRDLKAAQVRRFECPNCGCTPFDCAKSPTPAECANCTLGTCCYWKVSKSKTIQFSQL